jgi:hypothetical protein
VAFLQKLVGRVGVRPYNNDRRIVILIRCHFQMGKTEENEMTEYLTSGSTGSPINLAPGEPHRWVQWL